MKIAIIYNQDLTRVINRFGIQNKEIYNPATVKRVAQALEQGGHNVQIIDGNMHVVEMLENFMPKVVEGERMGMVFNMAYGIQGESRYTHLPSMLEMLGIPYVGSTPAGHALALDKVITKIIMQKHGIPTPNFWVFNNGDEAMDDVEFPVIVKPKMESVSFGLRVVYNIEDLRDAVRYIVAEFQQQALVEQFIRGREFAVGLLGNNPVEAFPVLEIDLENDPNAIQTVDDKKSTPRTKICPAHLDPEIAKEITKWSIAAFKALGLRDFARVDIRLDENNNIYLLEINSMASLGMSGSYPYAAQVAGYDYSALVNKMLDVAAVRYFAGTEVLSTQPNSKKQPTHVRVRSFLRGRQSTYEEMLKKMVNINCHVRNSQGVNTLGNFVKKELSSIGFAFQTFPQVEIGNLLYFSNSNTEDVDVLLLGNLDNDVKASKMEYFRAGEQKFYGTGIWEHKGGLVTLLAALQALRFIKQIRKLKIGILLTTDDSLQGRLSKSIILQKSIFSKNILGMHGAFLNGGIVTSRSGAAVYHVAMNLINPQEAEDVSVACRVFTKLVEDWGALGNADQGNIIAPKHMSIESNITEPYAHAEATLSVRFNDKESMKEIDKKIRNLVPTRKYKNKLDFQIEGGIRRPSMLKSDSVMNLYKTIKSLSTNLDIVLREEHRWSSADISFIDEHKNMIDGMGLIGAKPSDKSEFILRHSIIERATLLSMTLLELAKKG